MSNGLRIFLAVLIISVLIVIFIVTFILYKKTPVPKGCEDLGPSEEKCSSCKDEHCHLNIYATHKEEKKK